jgi:ABC-type lipoprotein export system ATPase subunit
VVVSAVSRRFRSPGGDVDALVDVTVDVERASMTVLAGPSGSGKSTLLMLMAAADLPDSGEIEVEGVSLLRMSRRERRRWRRDRLGIVMPQPSDNLTERHDVAGNLIWASALRASRTPIDRATALEALRALELEQLASAPITHLSGGQQMRLALLCASVGAPTLVLVDEPTASLDAVAADNVVALLTRLVDGGATLLVATHDPAIIEAAGQVVRLDHGSVVA